MTSPSRVEIDGCSPPYRHSEFPAGSLRYASRQELIKFLDERGEVFGLNGVRVVLVKLVRVRVVVVSALRDRAIALGERAKMVVPRGVAHAPAVDEHDGNALPLLDAVQLHAVGSGYLLQLRRLFRLLGRLERRHCQQREDDE
jgi:hypothetical protein